MNIHITDTHHGPWAWAPTLFVCYVNMYVYLCIFVYLYVSSCVYLFISLISLLVVPGQYIRYQLSFRSADRRCAVLCCMLSRGHAGK